MRIAIVLINLIFVGCLLLCSCAKTPLPQNFRNLTWQQRKQQLKTINHWQFNGAVAIQTPQKALSASINWQQAIHKSYVINLFGPLGLGAVKLVGNAQTSMLYANQQIYYAKNPEQLMATNLGWQLPVSNLYYWVRGLPAPNLASVVTFDYYHHLSQLEQQGWVIRYEQYTSAANIDLPQKIILQNHQIKAVLVISSWQI